MNVILLAALTLLAPTAAAALPTPGDAVCASEDFLTGTHEACDEWRSPARAYHATSCRASWVVAHHEHGEEYGCDALADAETNWGTYYLDPAPYTETNGCEGLQREPSDCDGDGDIEPRDASPLRGWTLDDLLP